MTANANTTHDPERTVDTTNTQRNTDTDTTDADPGDTRVDTVTEQPVNQDQDQNRDGDGDETGFLYACPYCDTAYPNEILARVHITRSTDDDHENRDGFMPETHIEQLRIEDTNHNDTTTSTDPSSEHDTVDTELVDTLSKRPRDIDTDSITAADIPDDHTDQHRHILATAARNPYIDDYSELKTIADTHLETNDLNTLSYSTVRRVVRKYYHASPHRTSTNPDSTATSTSNGETLADLTLKQQAIIIAALQHPDDPNTAIAARTQTAQSYPPQVFDKHGEVHDELRDRLEQTSRTVTELVQNELDDDRITELINQGLLKDVAINPDALRTGTTTDSNRDGSVEDEQAPRVADGPVTAQRTVMSASPYTTRGSPRSTEETGETTAPDHSHDTQTTLGNTVPGTETQAEPSDTTGDDSTDTTDADPGDDTTDSQTGAVTSVDEPGGGGVPVTELERVRDRIEFAATVIEHEHALQHDTPADTGENVRGDASWCVAFANQALGEIQELLETHTQAS